jgi:hypothetical protein
MKPNKITRKHKRNKTRNRRRRFNKTRKYMKGGDRPELNILKGINLFNEEIGQYINPFYGCVYTELKIVDTMLNLYSIPVDEPILDEYDTQHNRLIGLVFHYLGDRVEPYHKLRDSDTLSIHDLSHFIGLRLVWSMYHRFPTSHDTYKYAVDYVGISIRTNKAEKYVLRLLETEGAESSKYIKENAKLMKLKAALHELTDKLVVSMAEHIPMYEAEGFNIHEIVDTNHPIAKLRDIVDDIGNHNLRKIKQFIPLGTYTSPESFRILLALLWWKCPTKRHFVEFYTIIKGYIDTFLPKHTFEIPDGFAEELFTDEDINVEYVDLDHTNPYLMFYHNSIKHSSPPIKLNVSVIGYANTHFYMGDRKIKFTDCGESTIRNLIRIVSFNNETNKMDFDKLRHLGAIPEVIEYFTKYPVGGENERLNEARDEWAAIISNNEGIKYVKHRVCELDAGTIDNMEKIMAKLLTRTEHIRDLQVGDIEFLNVMDPDNAERVAEIMEKINAGSYGNTQYIILFKGIPQYLWQSIYEHAHLERVKMKHDVEDVERDIAGMENYELELIHYSDAIHMELNELRGSYGTVFNQYLVPHEYFLAKYKAFKIPDEELPYFTPIHNAAGINIDEVSEAFEIVMEYQDYSVSRLNRSNMSILASNPDLPYKAIAHDLVTRVYSHDTNDYNIPYLIRNTNALHHFIEFDEHNNILFYKLKLNPAEFAELEHHNMISPQLKGLKLVSNDYDDAIVGIMERYPHITTLVIHNYHIQPAADFTLNNVVSLSIQQMDKPYITEDKLKLLCVSKLFPEDIEFIPKSIETLIIDATHPPPLPSIFPNLTTLHIKRVPPIINDSIIPNTVKTLYLGNTHMDLYKLYPDFALISSFAPFVIHVIEHIPDNVEELYISNYMRNDEFNLTMHAGAFPSLKKLHIIDDVLHGEPHEIIELNADIFREVDMDTIELVGCVIVPV